LKLSSLFDDDDLSARVHEAEREAFVRLSRLTPTQHRVLNEMLTGNPNKIIAFKLNLSQRTVENHRAALMNRVGCKNILALARLVVVAGYDGSERNGYESSKIHKDIQSEEQEE
jgi:two-component system CheB/CheR fusion protein